MRIQLEQYANSLELPQAELENLTPIQYAAKYGDAEFIEKSLTAIPKSQWPDILKQQTVKGGFSALHYAARFGHVGCVKTLLDFGAQVNQVTSLQQLPMHLALTNQNSKRETKLELFTLLNTDPALLTQSNLNGDNIAHLAAEANLPEILIVIRETNDKAFNSKNKQMLTPLLVSILNRAMSSAKILMEHTPSLHEKDSNERNALHYAAIYGDVSSVSLLLPYFDPKQLDHSGHDAFYYIQKRQDPAFTALIPNPELSSPKLL